MTDEELRYTLALVSIKGIGSMKARHLIEALGSAESVMKCDTRTLLHAGSIGELVMNGRNQGALEKADQELQFINDHHIKVLKFGEEGYPKRLLECPDAPTLLFYLGNTNLDSKHIVSIIGTRACTQYGRDNVDRFVYDLKQAIPDTIIVSGLAIGVDIAGHRAALQHGLKTVGVVAHGLDRIYPTAHRSEARQMIEQGGGIITEYLSGTEPIAGNFLARNRIIAGLSDAILVAESREKGGSLVTANIGFDYNRDIFAFPGRIGDDRSKGCNNLIRRNKASLITCAQDLIELMDWDQDTKPHQLTIDFGDQQYNEGNGNTEMLDATARRIMNALQQYGDMRSSQICDRTGEDSLVVTEKLFDLEMAGLIRSMPGGVYRLK